jgi:hypothetical protein
LLERYDVCPWRLSSIESHLSSELVFSRKSKLSLEPLDIHIVLRSPQL